MGMHPRTVPHLQNQATSIERPMRRRRLMSLRPFLVRIRTRKPHLRLRLILLILCG